MRECLQKYLAQFSKIYPTRPAFETWEVYERVLSDVSDVDVSAACEVCLRELTYFPMPAQIWERVKKPDNFISTARRYEDNPPTPEAKEEFDREMRKAAEKIGIRKIAAGKTL